MHSTSVISVSTWTKCTTELQRQEPVLPYFIVWNVFLRVCAGKDGWQTFLPFHLFTFLVLCLSMVHCIHPFHSWTERNSIEKCSVFCPPRRSTSFGSNLSENISLICFLLLLYPVQTQDWYNLALSQHNCIKIIDIIMAGSRSLALNLPAWGWPQHLSVFSCHRDWSLHASWGTKHLFSTAPCSWRRLAHTERSLTLCYVSISRCAAGMEISVPTHFHIEK